MTVLVDLGAFALGLQPHVLAGRVGDLAHDARHALEQRPHRLGADRHHAFLDLARQMFEIVEAGGDAGVLDGAGLQHALRQHRLVDHQFADQIDQPVDAVEIDADRVLRGVGWRRRRRPSPPRAARDFWRRARPPSAPRRERGGRARLRLDDGIGPRAPRIRRAAPLPGQPRFRPSASSASMSRWQSPSTNSNTSCDRSESCSLRSVARQESRTARAPDWRAAERRRSRNAPRSSRGAPSSRISRVVSLPLA